MIHSNSNSESASSPGRKTSKLWTLEWWMWELWLLQYDNIMNQGFWGAEWLRPLSADLRAVLRANAFYSCCWDAPAQCHHVFSLLRSHVSARFSRIWTLVFVTCALESRHRVTGGDDRALGVALKTAWQLYMRGWDMNLEQSACPGQMKECTGGSAKLDHKRHPEAQ